MFADSPDRHTRWTRVGSRMEADWVGWALHHFLHEKHLPGAPVLKEKIQPTMVEPLRGCPLTVVSSGTAQARTQALAQDPSMVLVGEFWTHSHLFLKNTHWNGTDLSDIFQMSCFQAGRLQCTKSPGAQTCYPHLLGFFSVGQ